MACAFSCICSHLACCTWQAVQHNLLATMPAYVAECTKPACQGGIPNSIMHRHSAQGCLIRGPVSPDQGHVYGLAPPQSPARAQAATAFTLALDEAVGAMHGAVEAAMPDPEIIAGIEAKPQALSKAAAREPVLSHCNGVLEGWASQAAALLAVGSPPAAVRVFCATPVPFDVLVHATCPSRRMQHALSGLEAPAAGARDACIFRLLLAGRCGGGREAAQVLSPCAARSRAADGWTQIL